MSMQFQGQFYPSAHIIYCQNSFILISLIGFSQHWSTLRKDTFSRDCEKNTSEAAFSLSRLLYKLKVKVLFSYLPCS